MGLFILGFKIYFYVFYICFFKSKIGVGGLCIFEVIKCNWCFWCDVYCGVFCKDFFFVFEY